MKSCVIELARSLYKTSSIKLPFSSSYCYSIDSVFQPFTYYLQWNVSENDSPYNICMDTLYRYCMCAVCYKYTCVERTFDSVCICSLLHQYILRLSLRTPDAKRNRGRSILFHYIESLIAINLYSHLSTVYIECVAILFDTCLHAEKASYSPVFFSSFSTIVSNPHLSFFLSFV